MSTKVIAASVAGTVLGHAAAAVLALVATSLLMTAHAYRVRDVREQLHAAEVEARAAYEAEQARTLRGRTRALWARVTRREVNA